MGKFIDSQGDAAIFNTLNDESSYWQIKMDDADKDKTIVTSHCRLFRFLRMSIGLKNAPATSQGVVGIILSKMKWEYALVYIEDVLMYARTVEEHLIHVEHVLYLLKDAKLTQTVEKCFLFKNVLAYLGHVVPYGRLQKATKTQDAVNGAQPPTIQTELRFV